jgi:hypothetical protein
MAIKQRRRVVENTIAQLRNCNIVSGKYRCKNPESADVAQFLSKYIRIVSVFVNRRIRKKPLRRLSTTPP